MHPSAPRHAFFCFSPFLRRRRPASCLDGVWWPACISGEAPLFQSDTNAIVSSGVWSFSRQHLTRKVVGRGRAAPLQASKEWERPIALLNGCYHCLGRFARGIRQFSSDGQGSRCIILNFEVWGGW